MEFPDVGWPAPAYPGADEVSGGFAPNGIMGEDGSVGVVGNAGGRGKPGVVGVPGGAATTGEPSITPNPAITHRLDHGVRITPSPARILAVRILSAVRTSKVEAQRP
ncbi:MAG: hypothetical protein RMJ56_12840 [Gemmataceae bacterium]|nr:hypothetical protein [Gemmata sp.]MDW8198481.1 hypothetical protein [Gemmataceae bacterium]